MNIDYIVIGNELLNGKIQDLNTHFLAKELYQRNYCLRKVHIIGDYEEDFHTALIEASKFSDVIITSGGLGPTKDDITKSMFAKFFNKTIEFSQAALDISKQHYQRGNREYKQDKIDYHNLPQEFNPIFNPEGYAPGLHFEDQGKKYFATPGVPTEFQSMLLHEIFPRLEQKQNHFIKHIIFKTWQLAEANIFHKLCPDLWDQLITFGEVSSLPHLVGVDIAIKLVEKSEADLKIKEEEVTKLVFSTPLKDFIWHIGEETIEEVIISEAKKKNLKLGFAESCTGGLLASKITDISGSSSVFWGSIISYSNEVKMNCLQVNERTLINHGAVSEQTALEMAQGARKNLSVDIAITTTGIAGPGGATEDKPVGTVGIGIASSKSESSKLYYFKGSRLVLKEKFAQMALFKMLEEIRKF